MAIRKIIEIDEEKCDGCGLCVPGCPEGALQIIDGKAKLVNESFCDGMGACIGECPRDAIKMVEKEAPEFDEEEVKARMSLAVSRSSQVQHYPACPGSALRSFEKKAPAPPSLERSSPSQLANWPVQLMLVPPTAPYLRHADLLICADCVPFALADFHGRYLSGRKVLIGCPKLDDLNHYFEKLKVIFKTAEPNSLLVLKMEVPCCNGIASAAIAARDAVKPQLKMDVETVGIQGEIIVDESKRRKLPFGNRNAGQ